jgi:hypothetical protein
MVIISLARHREAQHAGEIGRFMKKMCRQFSLDEDRIAGVAHTIAGLLAAQYYFLLASGGDGHILEPRRDKYVYGYVMGYVTAACGDAGYLASSTEALLCWVLVVQKVFCMSLREATLLLEYCETECKFSGDDEIFRTGIVEGGVDRDLSTRGAQGGKLMEYLRNQRV